MRGRSLNDIIERRLVERDASTGERLVDLEIRFVLDGQVLLEVGGMWDRRADDFDGEATRFVEIHCHPGQRAAVEWFAAWLDAHQHRREHPPEVNEDDLDSDEVLLDTDPAHAYAALFAGGRRAGKTWIAVALAVAYAVMFPGALVWLVSPADTADDEMRRYLAGCLAAEWKEHETTDEVELCNGSRIMFKSAYNPEALKEGEVDFAVLNEGQRMKRRAFTLARGAIIDRSGCVLVCANPPVEAKDEQWVSDFAAEASGGTRQAIYLHFDPRLNPHINRQALLSMRAELDERTFAIEVLGEFRAAADAVAYNWNRLANEKPVPTAGDCTAMFLSMIGEGDGIRQVVGLDVQRIPYIGGPIYRFFGHPDRELVLVWIAGEVVLDGGDEIDFCAAMLDAGLEPSETLIVCDASGQYQHSRRRTADAPPPEWTGRGSFDLIRGEGFRRIVPPDRRQRRNPQIQDRVRAFTSMICTGTGERRLFADPTLAPRTAKAIREWKTVHGTASRTQDVAHLGDGASYPVVRLFPRRILTPRASSTNPRAMSTTVSNVTTPAERPMPPELAVPPTQSRRGARGRGL